ncbi:MAG: universal stress protein [Betaproteobacteria bacterium]|nr:universal stress protein [Betaproteobacteria bacterium]MCC7217226.1 universal stress protein [Burkholderiales bacterium]
MYRNILVPVDGSKLSERAVAAAIALAAASGGSVVALHVYAKAWDGPYGTFEMSREVLADAYEQQARARADELFDAVRRKAEAAGVGFAATAVESDQVWRAVIASAKRRKCDMICMASHGRRGIAAALLGSETQKVLTHSHLPVLVIR